MCFVMIVEGCDDIAPKPAVALEGIDVEESIDIGRAVPEEFRHDLAPRSPAHVHAKLLSQPLDAAQMAEIASGKHAAAICDDVDVSTRCSGNRQHFVYRKIRMARAIA